MRKMNKRGQLALDVVEAVVMKLLVLAVLGVAVILALLTLGNSNLFASTQTGQGTANISVVNESFSPIAYSNTSGYQLLKANSSTSITIQAVWGSGNQSNGTQEAIANASFGGYNVSLGLGNFSVNSYGVLTNASTFQYGNISISYYENYNSNNNALNSITNNVSNGLTSFFGNAGTIFNILVAVVLISAVAIIILVVRRFAGQKRVSA